MARERERERGKPAEAGGEIWNGEICREQEIETKSRGGERGRSRESKGAAERRGGGTLTNTHTPGSD